MSILRFDALVVFAIIVISCGLLNVVLPIDIAVNFFFGWAVFLYRVVPRMHIDWPATGIAIGCTFGAAVCLHMFCRWLYDQRAKGAAETAWRPRWTAMILGVVVLMFLSGTFVVTQYLCVTAEPEKDSTGFALSHYAANVRLLASEPPRNVNNLPGGTSNAILAGEVWTKYRPWAQPDNWRDPAKGIHTTPDSFGSPISKNGVQFLFLDGSVRFMTKDMDREVLDALANPR